MDSVRKCGKTIRSPERELIAHVYNCCDVEANKKELAVPLSRPTERAAHYCRVSRKTICKIKNEIKSSPDGVLSTPGKHRKRPDHRNAIIDDCDRRAIKEVIEDFRINKKVVPTCAKLLPVLREKINFKWKETTLRKILREMGYKWKICSSKRKMLVPQQVSGRSSSPQASTSTSSLHNASNAQTNHQSKKSSVSVTPSSSPPQQALDVCLRWNSYYSNMQAVFPNLLTNEQFVDVTLAADGQSIKCHKVMLSACSSYFQDLLTNNPCPHPIILMKDVRFRELKDLVNFMYRGEVSVQQERLPSLLAAAEALQIKGLSGIPSDEESTHHSGPEDTQLPPDPPTPMTKRFGKRKASSIPQNSLSVKRQNNSVSHPRTPAPSKANTYAQQLSVTTPTQSINKKRQEGSASPSQNSSTLPVKSTPSSPSSGFSHNVIKEEPLDIADCNTTDDEVLDQSGGCAEEGYSRGASRSHTTVKNEPEYLENYNEDSEDSDSDDISDLDSPAGLHVMPEVVMDPGESNSY